MPIRTPQLPRQRATSWPTRRLSLLVVVLIAISTTCVDSACTRIASNEVDESYPLVDLRGRRDLNVLVISFDALRADALGAYGSERGATPHMDAFAADSIVFENAYSASPITPTSFAAFFSGMLPMKVFHRWKFDPPASLAEHLSRAGYTTAAFVNNVQLTDERSFDRGFDEYQWRKNVPDDALLDDALAWLAAHSRPQRPVFLWIHLLRPHAPYRAHPEARHLYRDPDYDGPFNDTSGIKFFTSEPRDLARLQDLYAGEVSMADRSFGRFLEALRSTDLLRSSIVVLTADHGEEFLEHGAFQHSQLYEEHLRIPLIIHHPNLDGGRRVGADVRSIDLMPTLLGLVGHSLDEPVDGFDLSSSEAPRPTPIIASITTAQVLVSIRDRHEKLIVTCHPTVGVELYNLESDPGEQIDLSRQNESTVRRLVRELHVHLDGSPCRTANVVRRNWEHSEVDPETLEALRALGYVR